MEDVFDVLWHDGYTVNKGRGTKYEHRPAPEKHLYRFMDKKSFDEGVYGFKFIDDEESNRYRDNENFVDREDMSLQLYNITANTDVEGLWFEEPEDGYFWTLGIHGTYEDDEGVESDYEIAVVGPREEKFKRPDEVAEEEAKSEFEDNYRDWRIDEGTAGIEEQLNTEI